MSTFQWWRSWHDAPMDHKWAVIAARSGVKTGIVSAIAWALMDYASQQVERGTVEGFDTEMYAIYSGFDEVEIAAVIQAMTDKGIIDDGKLVNWKKRQPEREDNSTARVTKHREMKRDETQCNAEKHKETPQSRLRVDKDKDKEEEQIAAPFSNSDDVHGALEKITGLPGGYKGAFDASEELFKMGASFLDIQSGYTWLCENGTKLKYYGQLVGPARTAMSQRLQDKNGKKTQKETVDLSGYTRA